MGNLVRNDWGRGRSSGLRVDNSRKHAGRRCRQGCRERQCAGAPQSRQKNGGKQRDVAESRASGSYGCCFCDSSSECWPSSCTHITVRAAMEGTESKVFADVTNPILPLPEQPVTSNKNPEDIGIS